MGKGGGGLAHIVTDLLTRKYTGLHSMDEA